MAPATIHKPASRVRGELKTEMRSFFASKKGQAASVAELREHLEAKFGSLPSSSVRSGVQDKRYFERVSRGVYRLRRGSE